MDRYSSMLAGLFAVAACSDFICFFPHFTQSSAKPPCLPVVPLRVCPSKHGQLATALQRRLKMRSAERINCG